MNITPRRILKAVVPYGALVAYRHARPRFDRMKLERVKQLELSQKFDELLFGAKTIKENKEPKVIVSLTSYGDRLYKTAPLAIASLFRQRIMPDKIILWLTFGEKPPRLLKRMVKNGLDIRYCEDLKSYKKLIPTLGAYPDSVIVTADDDMIYPKDWLSKMLVAHKKNPKIILANRARKIALSSDKMPASYWDWPHLESNIKNGHLIMPNGVGGVLYPPHSLSEKVLDKKLFMSRAPHGDDLWFWAMAELKNTKRAIVEDGFHDIADNMLDEVGLWNTVNRDEYTGNDAQFASILESFPELRKKIGLTAVRSNFPGSKTYWEDRYAKGGNSGTGSYDNLAEFKAEVINNFVKKNGIKTVMEFGTGDGNQLLLSEYPNYVGFDVSQTAVKICQKLFKGDKTKEFYTLDKFKNQNAELSMSLDVLYHLIEKDVFESHINDLFKAATKFVIIYAYDGDGIRTASHVKSRSFTDYIRHSVKDWRLVKHIPNKYPYDEADPGHTTWADFYVYKYVGKDSK